MVCAQLAASPNAEPLVHFFLQIIAMASDGCPGAAVSLQHAAAAPALQSIQREAPVSSDIHGCSQHLFDFISLAARLVLPQHIVPAAVVAALGEYLTGGPLQVVDALGDHQGPAAVYGGLAAFRGVAAAVLKSRELFAGLSSVCTGPEECAGDGYERIQHHPEQHLDIMQQFEIWKQQLLLQLQISKAELLRLLRISLTGKDTGLPLLQQVRGFITSPRLILPTSGCTQIRFCITCIESSGSGERDPSGARGVAWVAYKQL